MALPLCLGYIAARSGPRSTPHRITSRSRTRLAHAIDPRTAWLMAAAVDDARGAAAVAVAIGRARARRLRQSVTVIVCRQRLDAARRRRLLAAAAIVVVCGLAWADIPALRARVAGAPAGVANRLTIWRETMPDRP